MKYFYLIILSTLLTNFALAQGINKSGGRTTDPAQFINKNGAIGTPYGVDRNGQIIIAAIPTVTSLTNRIWMDRNLGASQIATSSTDAASFGDLYQWGRGKDGHQVRTSLPTQGPSDNVPPSGEFILASSDWRSTPNPNLWQGINGTNNPCPSGFRLPTKDEWDTELNTWSPKNSVGAYNSILKIPLSGNRPVSTGIVGSNWSTYWSSTAIGIYSTSLTITANSATIADTQPRGNGAAVRCIKEIVPATLTTNAISALTNTTAIGGGEVTNTGGTTVTARGVVWATTTAPTILLLTKTSDGTGVGVFTSSLTGLTANTTYYVRSYATTSAGTFYGNEVSFTTSGPPPLCDGSAATTQVVEIVSSVSGRIWMDRNLGAISASNGPTDFNAYGCLYQWGRGNDGHASITWTGGGQGQGTAVNGMSSTRTDTPGNGFIKPPADPWDWRSTQNATLWTSTGGTNNPCPAGFRVPTLTEMQESMPTYNDALNLKLVLAGGRYFYDGSIINQGSAYGMLSNYWTSETSATFSKTFVLKSSGAVDNSNQFRGNGFPVRCIKN